MRPLLFGRCGLALLLLIALCNSCGDHILSDSYPAPQRDRVALLFGPPQVMLPTGSEPCFGQLSSLRVIATDLQGKVVLNVRLQYGGNEKDIGRDLPKGSQLLLLQQQTYEFFFIANEEAFWLDSEAFLRLKSKRDVRRLLSFYALTRKGKHAWEIPMVGHLQRQLPRPTEPEGIIVLTPILYPSVALLEIHTPLNSQGEQDIEQVEVAFPTNRLDAGLFGYPYSPASDRHHELKYYRLAPRDESGTLYSIGLPEVRCYAPEALRWLGPEESNIVHLRVTLRGGEKKYLPLMMLPGSEEPKSYAEYLRIAGEEAPIGVQGVIERFSLYAGHYYRYSLQQLSPL